MLGKTIGFMGKKAKVYVYADQDLIYSWKNEGMPKNLKTYGWLCHLVDIPYDTKGQILSIKFDFDVPVDSKINPLDNHFIRCFWENGRKLFIQLPNKVLFLLCSV